MTGGTGTSTDMALIIKIKIHLSSMTEYKVANKGLAKQLSPMHGPDQDLIGFRTVAASWPLRPHPGHVGLYIPVPDLMGSI